MNKKNLRLILLVLLILMLILPILLVSKSSEIGHCKIIIRFDDYGIWCNKEWVELEEHLIKLHEKYDEKITFSVVPKSIYPVVYHPKSNIFYPHEEASSENPYPLEYGSRRVECIKESVMKGISEVAMHGYYHPKYYSNIKNSEFYNVDYDTQFFKIKDGKKILDSLICKEVTVFAPPHNNYDALTLDALSELGFQCITAKLYSQSSAFDDAIPLNNIAFTTDDFMKLYNKYLTNGGVSYTNLPADVLILHHTSFTNNKGVVQKKLIDDYENFLSLLKKNKITNVHFSESGKYRIPELNNSNRMMVVKFLKSLNLSPKMISNYLSTFEGLSYRNMFFFIPLYLISFFYILFLYCLSFMSLGRGRRLSIFYLLTTFLFVMVIGSFIYLDKFLY